MQLKGLKKLESLYLYQTNVDKKYFAALRTAFSKTRIDTGGYYVPTLATDTTEVKVKKAY